LGRVSAVVAIFLGVAVVGLNPDDRRDPVLLTLPQGNHGIHVTDVVGVVFVAVGVVALWYLPRRR
jgi:hypothetical protein